MNDIPFGCGFTSITTKVGKPKTWKDDAIQHEHCSATAPFLKQKKKIIIRLCVYIMVYMEWMLKRNIPM